MSAKIIIGIIVGLVVLGVGYYALSPLFITLKGNEALPTDSKTESEKNNSDVMKKDGAPLQASQEEFGALVVGTGGHPASGTARIVNTNGKQYLRYENFKTINGPDIYVYLAKDLEAKDFVNLGKVRVTDGNVNYEIPERVNIADYPYALTWCKTFSVLFNSAKIGK